MMRRAGLAAALAIAVPALLCGAAASAADVLLLGPGGRTQHIDPAGLARMPPAEIHLSFLAAHGTETTDYAGATLWSVLAGSGLITSDNPRDREKQAIVVTGRDGYAAVLAMAEIDPALEDKKVLLADQKNGQPMPDGELRLAVPGDHHGARSVRDVVRIEVRILAP